MDNGITAYDTLILDLLGDNKVGSEHEALHCLDDEAYNVDVPLGLVESGAW